MRKMLRHGEHEVLLLSVQKKYLVLAVPPGPSGVEPQYSRLFAILYCTLRQSPQIRDFLTHKGL